MGYDEIVPVRYEGGPLDGDINNQDYLPHELAVGDVFDWPTRGLGRGGVGAADTRERYVLERRGAGRGGQWVFVHTGQVVPPVADQAFEAVVAGGPNHGAVEYLLGTARRWEGQRIDHISRGCVLHHTGDDPTLGWELRYQDTADTVPDTAPPGAR